MGLQRVGHDWVTEQQQQTRDKRKWKHDIPKSMGCSKSSSKMEVFSNTGLPQETITISYN